MGSIVQRGNHGVPEQGLLILSGKLSFFSFVLVSFLLLYVCSVTSTQMVIFC
jgi:hypothetical protein